VTDVQHANSGKKIEEGVPVYIPDSCTFSLLNRDWYAPRISNGVAVDFSLSSQQLFCPWSGDRPHIWFHRKVDVVNWWN